MALRENDQANFQTLLRAALNGDLALVQCKDALTGEYRAVIAIVTFNKENEEYEIIPFGHLATGNPYEQYVAPYIRG